MRQYKGLWPWAVFCAVFVAFALAAPDTFINGDAVVYAAQIQAANFAERTTHLGYYLAAYPVSLVPISLSHALNLLNCAFGAGVAVLVGLIGAQLSGSALVGPVSALVLVANTFLVGNALHAEVYISQTFFLMLSMYLWQRERPVWAGAGCAAAFLVTASSVFAAPYFILMRPKWRPLLLLGATAGVLAVAALLPVIQNYLFGARGLLVAAEHAVDYRLAALKTGRDLFFGFFALLPFLFAGAVECRRRPELRRFGLAVAAMAVTVFLFGEKFTDVPVQLPTYALASIIAAIGIEAVLIGRRRPANLGAIAGACLVVPILLVTPYVPVALAHHLPGKDQLALYGTAAALTAVVLRVVTSRRAAAVLVALMVLCNLYVVLRDEIEIREKLRATDRIAQTIRETRNAVFVAKWNTMVRLNWLLHGLPYDPGGFDLDQLDGGYDSTEAMELFKQALARKDAVLLLDSTPKVERLVSGMGFVLDGAAIYRRK